jgi:maleate isomerase
MTTAARWSSARARPVADARYRVGLLLPSSNNALEWELTRQLPRWASLHAQRMFHTDADFASLERVHDALPEAAAVVATVRPHLVVVGCTAVSGLDHGQFEQQVVPRIEAAVKAPVITVLPAVLERLRQEGCTRIVLVTPHGPEIDAVLVQALESQGITVRETHSMGIRDNFELGQVPVSCIVGFVAECLRQPLGPSDALFLSCTNFRSAEALPELRRRYGPRVISSVQTLVDRTLAALAELRAGAAPMRAAGPATPGMEPKEEPERLACARRHAMT